MLDFKKELNVTSTSKFVNLIGSLVTVSIVLMMVVTVTILILYSTLLISYIIISSKANKQTHNNMKNVRCHVIRL